MHACIHAATHVHVHEHVCVCVCVLSVYVYMCSICAYLYVNSWFGGQVGGWIDGRMDGRTGGRIDGWMDGWMDCWGINKKSCTQGYVGVALSAQSLCMNVCMHGWMDG